MDKSFERILSKISRETNFSVKVILSPSRKAGVVCARALIAKALREKGLSYPQIGKYLQRDHSTVINLVRKSGELEIIRQKPRQTTKVKNREEVEKYRRRGLREKAVLVGEG